MLAETDAAEILLLAATEALEIDLTASWLACETDLLASIEADVDDLLKLDALTVANDDRELAKDEADLLAE